MKNLQKVDNLLPETSRIVGQHQVGSRGELGLPISIAGREA
jgi:hypothetical protein